MTFSFEHLNYQHFLIQMHMIALAENLTLRFATRLHLLGRRNEALACGLGRMSEGEGFGLNLNSF